MSGAIRYRIPTALAQMDRARHHVIEASAGTGKTFTIEHRVVDLLLGGAAIDQILVVTFTEKATAELRARVRRLIARVADAAVDTAADGEAAWLIDDPARARLVEALSNFDRAPIFTIHGFCQRVLTENAFGARRLFDQTQVASETAFGAAFKAVLREELARDPEHRAWLAAWLGGKHSVGDLQRLLYQCAEQHGAFTPVFDEAAITAAADTACASPIDFDQVDAALAAWKKHANTRNALRKRVVELAGHIDAYREDRALPRLLGNLDAMRPTSSKDKDYLALFASELPPISAAFAATQEWVGALAAAPSIDAAVVQRFLPPVRARVARDKHRRGELDFHDMLRLVWLAIDSDGGEVLAARLRERYHHALIDEFQDTDPLQWKIFRRLYLEDAGPGRLSIIGDPKQAIYSFRGADVFTYLDACREMSARGAQTTRLADNYRSTPALVDAYSLIFETRMGMSFFDGGIEYDPPVRAAAELRALDASGAEVAPIDIVTLEPPARGKLNAVKMRAGHLRFVRDEILGLLGDAPLRIGPPGAEERVGPGDIYVLTRSLAESEQVAVELRNAGVPCALFKQEGLFRTAEANEVRDLLAGIADPRSRSARLRAWQTRFFAPRLADLPDLGDLPETHPLVARLYEWNTLADRLAYEELFARIIADSGVVERELFLEPSERALTNFVHLFELLLEEVVGSRCELHELILRLQHLIDDFEENSADERNIQRLESEPDAVQIMTVHKAKGLEAGVVFLFGGFNAGGGGRDNVSVYHRGAERVVHIGKPRPAEASDEAAWEDQRLVYVTLTRAVGKLYLPYVDYDTTSASPGMIARLNQRLADVIRVHGDGTEPRVDHGFALRTIPSAPAPASASHGAPPRAAPWRPPAPLLEPVADDPAYAELRRRAGGWRVTSYTGIKKRRPEAPPIARDDLAVGVDSAAVELSPHNLPGGAASGIFLHDVLERVPIVSFDGGVELETWRARPEVSALFRDARMRHGIDARHEAHSQAMVHAALTGSFRVGDTTLPPLASCARAQRELEFLYPTRSGRTFFKGFIDLVFEAHGLAYVLDWKSDVLGDYGAQALARHTAAQYAVQSELYALALIHMLGGDDRFGGVIYCYLRGLRDDAGPQEGIYFERPDPARVRAAADRLERELAS